MSHVTIGMILLSVFLSSVSQLILKSGMSDSEITSVILQKDIWRVPILLITNLSVVLGLSLYAFGAITWLLVLNKIEVSRAYPFMGLAFILTMFMASIFLNEELSIGRITGTMLVAVGIFIVAKS